MTTPIPRIFCIGNNYEAHIRELGDTPQPKPFVFMKPLGSLLPPGAPIPFPRHGSDLHHEVELVIRIGTSCTDVPASEAPDVIDAWTLGLDLTLRDLQTALRAKGGPWELCKAFDGSAPMGEMVPYTGQPLDGVALSCLVNGETRQSGHTRDMIVSAAGLVEYLSGIWTLCPGDLIMTGTPPGVGSLRRGDRVEVASPEIGSWSWEVVDGIAGSGDRKG